MSCRSFFAKWFSLSLILGVFAEQASAQAVITQTSTTTFPITISKSGSYILKSNIVLPSGTQKATILITASNVTLDLNGFTVRGTSSFDGPVIQGAGSVTLRNGDIVNGEPAVGLGGSADIEHVAAASDIELFVVGSDSKIIDSAGESGITCGANCLIEGNEAGGISTGSFSSVANNIVGNTPAVQSPSIVCGTKSMMTRNVLQFGFSGCTSLGDNLCNGTKC